LDLDAAEANAVSVARDLNMASCITIALETTFWTSNDGPDSFFFCGILNKYSSRTCDALVFRRRSLRVTGTGGIRRKAKKA
jgi:hypothetical protein